MMKETNEPRNATEARRHRTSVKAKKTTAATVTARPKLSAKTRRVRAEDKRESTHEVDTDARAKNIDNDTNSRKVKGHATHALESVEPGKRPSRKSTRRGANGIKPDAQKRRAVTRKVRSAQSRHATAS